MTIIEIIILVIIICALAAIGFLSYNVIKTSIDEKAPKEAVAQVQKNIESTNLKLSSNEIASAANDLKFKTDYENNVGKFKKEIKDLMDVQSTNYGNLNTDVEKSKIEFRKNILDIKTDQGYLKTELANIANISTDKTLKFGSTIGVDNVSFVKPVQVEKLNIGPNWNIREVERALCFYKLDKKVVCLDDMAIQPVILYKDGIPITAPLTSTTPLTSTVPVTATTPVVTPPFSTGTGIASTGVASTTPIVAGGGTTTTTGVVGGLPVMAPGVVV